MEIGFKIKVGVLDCFTCVVNIVIIITNIIVSNHNFIIMIFCLVYDDIWGPELAMTVRLDDDKVPGL